VTTCKSQGLLFDRARSHSPFDVVAWHGSYAPCKYALRRFVALGSVSVDHPDPSVLTVLSLPGGAADGGGRSAVDFAIFPPRWLCAERTFRPPYFHRNCCAEFMGLIDGSYDAKVPTPRPRHRGVRSCARARRAHARPRPRSRARAPAPRVPSAVRRAQVGFVPGASSLHNVGVPHGPDAATYRMALDGETSTPLHFKNGTAFMFETAHPLKLTAFAAASMDASYAACWEGLPRAPAPHHVYAAGQPHAAGHYRRRAGTSGANAVTLPHAAELAAMRAHVGP
jgi:homogentisate 1,2-dioxygenase